MKSFVSRWTLPLALTLACAFAAPAASAGVKKVGDWPKEEKRVTFTFDGAPTTGVQRLAEKAGWSLVVPKSVELKESEVHVAVKDQPADAVLEALFAEGDFVAKRTGSLVVMSVDKGPAPSSPDAAAPPAKPEADDDTAPAAPPPPAAAKEPVPPAPPAAAAAPKSAPPVPTVRGEDRTVTGGSLVVEAGEVVHTVSVMGGSVKVRGTITGDLVVAGGSAKIEEGGRVVGSATVFGGSLKMESGSRVDGDVGVVGGSLKREDGAIIGGAVVDGEHRGNVKVTAGDDGVSTQVTERPADKRGRLSRAAHDVGSAITRMALLFVFGCILLALAPQRMERLRVEVAARPMRSFALGVVSLLAGAVGLVVLCVTIIGVPIAAILSVLAIFGTYASVAAALTTAGAAVLQHRTPNPYLHLLLGCGAFLVLGNIPVIGGILTFVLTCMGVGVLVSTRAAGFIKPKKAA